MIATDFVSYDDMSLLKTVDWNYYSVCRDAWNRGEMTTADAEINFQVWIPSLLECAEEGTDPSGQTVAQLRGKHAALQLLLSEIFEEMGQDFDPNADYSF
jgi:hypothetical protein